MRRPGAFPPSGNTGGKWHDLTRIRAWYYDGNVRLNLSLPKEIDRCLSELARATGRTKASFALEALTVQLPRWWKWVRRLERARQAVSAGPVIGKKAQAVVGVPARMKGEGRAQYQLRVKRWRERQSKA